MEAFPVDVKTTGHRPLRRESEKVRDSGGVLPAMKEVPRACGLRAKGAGGSRGLGDSICERVSSQALERKFRDATT